METEEQWADDILKSLDGIKKAEPGADLFAKITAQLPEENDVKIIPLQRLVWLAAAASIVIAINIHVFNTQNNTDANSTSETTELLNDYVLYKTN